MNFSAWISRFHVVGPMASWLIISSVMETLFALSKDTNPNRSATMNSTSPSFVMLTPVHRSIHKSLSFGTVTSRIVPLIAIPSVPTCIGSFRMSLNQIPFVSVISGNVLSYSFKSALLVSETAFILVLLRIWVIGFISASFEGTASICFATMNFFFHFPFLA